MTAVVAPVSLLTVTVRTDGGEWPIQECPGWELTMVEQPWDGPGQQIHICASWHGGAPTPAGLVIRRRLAGAAPATVLAPGVYYGAGGPGGAARDVAAARTPLPAVFFLGEARLTWLAIEPHGAGVGFSLPAGGDDTAPELRVHRPALERPGGHDRAGATPAAPLLDIAPGGSIACTVWHGELPPDLPEGVARVQRALQRAWGGGAGRPVDTARALAAADAAAEGLLRWHYRPERGSFAEAVAFDGTPCRDDRPDAGRSGAPTAYALLHHGLTRGDHDATAAARAALDALAGERAPCGAFFDSWTPRERPDGEDDAPPALRARTLAEATLFLVRALSLEPGRDRWAAAARANLDFCLRAIDERGNPGTSYHAETGAVLDRRGTAGLLWAAALAEAADLFAAPDYLDAAARIGACFAPAIREGRLSGAPGDGGDSPASEDGYDALIATMALYGTTGEERWLRLARAAADWLLTFRWSYDVRLPADTPLARRRFRTRGGDLASPADHHLQLNGLICQRELLRLAELSDDSWYLDRAADHLACFQDEIALRDGQFGGPERRGMLPARWYTADRPPDGRAGEVAAVSRAGRLGLLLLAAEEWVDRDPALARDGAVSAASKAERVRAAARLREGAVNAPPGGGRARQAPRALATPDRPHPVRLLPGLYQVGGGHLSHPRDASSYLLVDEATGEGLMIDCGSHGGLDAVRANIGQVADLARLRLVIGTHCHWDHIEAFSHLRHETAALFAIHHLDARAVRIGDPDLTCAGFLYNEPFHAFPVDLLLKGGERFTLGGFTLEILHLPGHSPGSIGVKLHYALTDQTILIPGDAVEGGFSKRIHSSVASWKRSMRRLLRERIDLMLPSHLPNGAQTALLGDVPNRVARVYNQLETDFHLFMPAQRA